MDSNHKLLVVLVNLVILVITLALAIPVSATELVPQEGNTSATDKAVANWWVPAGILGGLILVMILFSIAASFYHVVCLNCQWRGIYPRWKWHGGCPRCHSDSFYEEQSK